MSHTSSQPVEVLALLARGPHSSAICAGDDLGFRCIALLHLLMERSFDLPSNTKTMIFVGSLYNSYMYRPVSEGPTKLGVLIVSGNSRPSGGDLTLQGTLRGTHGRRPLHLGSWRALGRLGESLFMGPLIGGPL